MSLIFTLVIGAISIYFFYANNFFVAVITLVWALFRVFGGTLNLINSKKKVEVKSNASLEFKINIAQIFKTDLVKKLFSKLKERTNFSYKNEEEWTDALIENFKRKFNIKEDYEHKGIRCVWHKVKFNIKNNLLWKDGQVDFNDTIYEEWFTPHTKQEDDNFFTTITNGITVRLVLANGILKLQVGDFDMESSPEILKEGSWGVYKQYASVTSFPLIYFSYFHCIPENYLNLSMEATDSYWKRFKGVDKVAGEDYMDDWKKINAEIPEYNYVCTFANEYIEDSKKWEGIVKKFDEKKDAMLQLEDFKNLSFVPSGDEYVPDYMQDNNIHYSNKYLLVFIVNLNDYKEKREKYVYPDYREDRFLI